MSDDYADLPGWVRPGADGAMLHTDAAVLVKVKHITPTQVVCERAGDRMRIRVRRDNLTQQGHPTATLERRDHTAVVQFRIAAVIADLRQAVRAAAMPKFGKDQRGQEEIAAELLDRLEQLTGRARRKVGNLVDPNGIVAPEYAQELEPEVGRAIPSAQELAR